MGAQTFTVYDLLVRGASLHGDAPALIQSARQWTFRQLLERDVLPQALGELPRGEWWILRARDVLELALGELAVLLELGHRHDPLAEPLVVEIEVTPRRLGGDHALGDHLVEHRAARVGCVEHRRIDATAEHARQAFLLGAQLLVELAPRDVGAVHARYRVVRAAVARIGLDAPGRERDRDETEHDLQEAPMLLDEIEHGRDAILPARTAASA